MRPNIEPVIPVENWHIGLQSNADGLESDTEVLAVDLGR
jgi:hypothetical protein